MANLTSSRTLVLFALALPAACDWASGPNRAGIEVKPAEVRLLVGDTFWVTAIVYDDRGRAIDTATVEWPASGYSLRIRMASVNRRGAESQRGRVVGLGPGPAWAVAESGGRRDSAQVLVQGHEIALRSVHAGEFTCGLTPDGRAYCWGPQMDLAPHGQVTNYYNAPVPVPGDTRFETVTVGSGHACGLDSGGIAYCWGFGSVYGILGSGPAGPTVIPRRVSGELRFASLAAGMFHTCGVTDDGTAYCWGDDSYGQLGIGEPVEECAGAPCSSVPVPVSGSHTFRLVKPGGHYTCGLTYGGNAFCWGMNVYHQLGNESAVQEECDDDILGGTNPCSRVPVPVQGVPPLDTLDVAGVACGLTTGGKAYCWGDNSGGALGNGGSDIWAPGPVSGGHTFRTISAGGPCALTPAGEAYCWGSNRYGQTGAEQSESCIDFGAPFPCNTLPVEVPGGQTFSSIEGGGNHACGITVGGLPYCWGNNDGGTLGIGDGITGRSTAPLQVYGTH